MSLIKDLMVSASVAVGNVASRERDRDVARFDDGRPRALGERAKGRVQAVMSEGAAKVAVSQTAHLAAKEAAKRLTGETAKKVAKALAKRPAAAAGAALFAFDSAREGYRLAKGSIDSVEFAERMGGNAAGIAGSAAGAHFGAMVGTMFMPLFGTVAGSVVGGVVGGVGGDTYGRRKIRDLMGYELVDDDDYEDD